MRLMMEFTGENRGFCFVTYATRAAAGRAVREADGLELRPGRALGVCRSVDNNRLFVGGLPRQRRRHEVGVVRELPDVQHAHLTLAVSDLCVAVADPGISGRGDDP